MENLKQALKKVLATVEQVAKAYQDGKIVWREWMQIGITALGLVWIFKNLKAVKTDIENATEEGIATMTAELQAEFDIPQEQLEETIEHALSFILTLLTLIGKKSPELSLKK